MVTLQTEMGEQIRRVYKPSREDFEVMTNHYTEPAIITGAIGDWVASKLWTLSYFEAKLKALPVVVSISQDGVFRGDPKSGFDKTQQRMPFRDFARRMANTDKGDACIKYYLSQNNIDAGPFSIISSDVGSLEYFRPGSKLQGRYVWVGPGNIISPLHFDSANNFFVQVTGEKEFVLFAPSQSDFLYPYPGDSKIPHMSQVDIDYPDLKRFSKFSLATPKRFGIIGGEVLFLPIGWWHQVYSTTESISINFWWN